MSNPPLDWYYNQLKEHYLEPIPTGEETAKYIKAFYLRKAPDTRMMSTLLIFHPEGITITGDCHPGRVPGRRGGVIARGYDLDWFSQKLEPSYLAEKFLTEVWVKEKFVEWVKEYLKDSEAVDTEAKEWLVGARLEENWTEKEALLYFISDEDLFETPESAYNNLPSYYDRDRWICPYDSEFISPGFDYDPTELGWLAAIQRRFSELINS